MSSHSGGDARAGRPRATTPAVLAEAACELFLEQGYEQTSVADIARRAGVSRSSFFNYFASKGEIVWSGFDRALGVCADAVRSGRTLFDGAQVFSTSEGMNALVLAVEHAEAMGITGELDRERASRQLAFARVIRSQDDEVSSLRSAVRAEAYAGVLFAAVWEWAGAGARAGELEALIGEGLRTLGLAEIPVPQRSGR